MPPGYLRWEELLTRPDISILVGEFSERHKGERGFLKHVWRTYAQWFSGPEKSRTVLGEYKRWVKIRDLSRELHKQVQQSNRDRLPIKPQSLAAIHFSDTDVDMLLRMVDGASKISQALIEGRGWTRHSRREYWCAVLLPYFDYRNSPRDRWNWVIRWLTAIEAEDALPDSDSMRDWWERRVMPSLTRDYLRDNEIDDRLTVILLAAFEYTSWRWPISKRTESDTAAIGRYVKVVRKRIPALKCALAPNYMPG